MKFKLALTLVLSLFLRVVIYSQNIPLIFLPKFGNNECKTFTYYKIGNSDSLQITALKFYISGIELWMDEKLVWKQKNSFHLIDISKPNSLNVNLNTFKEIKFDEVRFNLGIDSITNVSGALGGALDPTLGMYWTWQSGYINLKLEGNSNLCKTRNNEFQFHIGGYLKPFDALQQVVIKSHDNKKIGIEIDIEKIITSLNLKEKQHIMSPGKEAVLIAKQITKELKPSTY